MPPDPVTTVPPNASPAHGERDPPDPDDLLQIHTAALVPLLTTATKPGPTAICPALHGPLPTLFLQFVL